MKIAAFILAVALSSHAADLRLAWDYAPEELGTNMVFKLYSHTNANEPATNWAVTILPGTGTTARVVMIPERRFWFVTASNFWGESGPSNIAGAPNPATNVTGLKLSR